VESLTTFEDVEKLHVLLSSRGKEKNKKEEEFKSTKMEMY